METYMVLELHTMVPCNPQALCMLQTSSGPHKTWLIRECACVLQMRKSRLHLSDVSSFLCIPRCFQALLQGRTVDKPKIQKHQNLIIDLSYLIILMYRVIITFAQLGVSSCNISTLSLISCRLFCTIQKARKENKHTLAWKARNIRDHIRDCCKL